MKTEISKFELRSLPLLLLLCLMANLDVCKTNLAFDEATLLAIKTHISSSHDHILALNWTTSVPVCNWIGVSCGRRHERVTALDLSNMDLTTTIPPHIANLSFLTSIALSNNGFHGRLPSELARLRRLKHLSLSNNSLVGTIPSALFINASKLEYLYLGKNFLYGSIPNEIGKLVNLREFDASYNRFSSNIPGNITSLQYLQVLRLESNNLTVDSPTNERNFFSSLGNCKSLRYLSLSNNPLHSMFPSSITNLSFSLERFRAYDCGLFGEIPSGIGNLSNLLVLSIAKNDLPGHIPKTIGRLQKLQSLDLPANRLKGSIPSELCTLTNVYLIELDGNDLSGGLPACLSNLTSLRHLYLSNNNISSSIPLKIWSLGYILKIDISSNSLNGGIPAEIRNLKVLLRLDVSGNKLSGPLPDSFQNLQDLTYISVANNGFYGSIPKSFGELKSLKVLNLSRNAFSGAIPESLGSLTSLKEFNVSFNDLEGEIPTVGIFKNLSAQSFLGNPALCGNPIQRCRNKARSSSKPLKKYYILAAAVLAAALSITVTAIIAAKRRKKRSANAPDDENPSTLVALKRISMLELERATNIFDDANLLGVGTFGKVYKGTLSDGITVAVKTFNMDLEEGFKSFDVECEVLREFRHRNLVKVISSCCNINFKALVLEYMPRGSLEKWLYSHNYFLDILQRLNIMIDVGAGIDYLHNGHSSTVVHCDLKPNNVLLDEDMVAHVSDYGIAKLLGEGKSMTKTLTLATIGYMAPEYGSSGTISTKTDVYGFGILLMETFTRKKPTDAAFVGEMNLKRWVKDSLPDAVADVVDWNLLQRVETNIEAKISCVSSILQLGLECCADSPKDRGNMKDVLAEMTKIRNKFPKDIRRA